MIPSTHPAKNDQVVRDNNNRGESNMIKEKVINNLPYPIPNTYNLQPCP